MKSAGEFMETLEAFDRTGSLRDAGELAGCSHHTVARYVTAREAGGLSGRPAARERLIEGFLPKVEEWVEKSDGRIRADVAHGRLVALGFTGSERTTRRAVTAAKAAYRVGRLRVHRPWVTEPGMWLQPRPALDAPHPESAFPLKITRSSTTKRDRHVPHNTPRSS